MTDTLWQFDTARFSIVCTAEEEWDVDLSWDETGETAEKLASGEYVVFCAKVAVYLDGREVAADYLGQCIYADAADFTTGHRDTDPMNRNCSIMRKGRGNISICHYFPDMVATAVAEARKALTNLPTLRAA